jgi:regulator of replication initiation timing
MENIIDQSTIESNLTILEMMAEIERLKQENQQLKEENNKLRNDNDNLHSLIFASQNIEDEDNNQSGWTEEEFDIVAQAYAEAEKDYKFV